ncbi:MAG: hypothetical protein KF774_13035 [Planctomyces sp.]|nr:hypothetical protein [Planctomyces sp.]
MRVRSGKPGKLNGAAECSNDGLGLFQREWREEFVGSGRFFGATLLCGRRLDGGGHRAGR